MTTDELIKEDKPKTIELEGKNYTLSPINLTVMGYVEEEFDCGFSELQKILASKKTKEATAILKLIYVLLKDNHPELTKSALGRMITIENMEQVASAIKETLTP